MSRRQRREHRELFCSSRGGSETLVFQRAIAGQLRDSSVRGVCWRYFLGALSGPPAGWPVQVREQQAAFSALCVEHCVELDHAADALTTDDVTVCNPLSVDEASPYARFFAGSALREEIGRDLERLHPGNAFFEQPAVQRLLLRVLFVWSRSHPVLSYRQGMHELLAPCVSVLWAEAAEAAEARSAPSAPDVDALGAGAPLCSGGGGGGGQWGPPSWPADEATDVVAQQLDELLKPEFVEAAAWALFSRLMSCVRRWFEHSPRPSPGSAIGAASAQLSALHRKCAHIQETLLMQADPALHLRLGELGIEPQLYLLRWLRLLFGREFHFEDVKLLWDAIFAFGVDETDRHASMHADANGSHITGGEIAATVDAPSAALVLVDYVALAMLVYVRADLLSRDFTFCMRRLLHFPPMEEVHFLVQRALQLKRTEGTLVASMRRLPPPPVPPPVASAALPAPEPWRHTGTAPEPWRHTGTAPEPWLIPGVPPQFIDVPRAPPPQSAALPVSGAAVAPFKFDVPTRASPSAMPESATMISSALDRSSPSVATSPPALIAALLTPQSLPNGSAAAAAAATSPRGADTCAPRTTTAAAKPIGADVMLANLISRPAPRGGLMSDTLMSSSISSSPHSPSDESSLVSDSPGVGVNLGVGVNSGSLAARMGAALSVIRAELGNHSNAQLLRALDSALDDLDACQRELAAEDLMTDVSALSSASFTRTTRSPG